LLRFDHRLEHALLWGLDDAEESDCQLGGHREVVTGPIGQSQGVRPVRLA
jgi:hypothetical protein